MRPGQQNKRGRGRGGSGGGGGGGGGSSGNNNNNRKGQNPLSRSYDSSGPDVKIRGTAQHIAEKYMNLARDSQSSGDRVMAENYLQHAEHYNRIIAAAQAQMQERFQRDDRDHQGRDSGDNDDSGDDDTDLDTSVNGNVAQQGYANGNGHHQEGRQDRAERSERPERAERHERAERQERSERAERPERAEQRTTFEPDAPQPVIPGTPAEVALEQETPADGARASRRRGRPRRSRAAGDAPDAGDGEAAPPEVAAAD
jgi:hypothetical protein